MKKLDFFRSVNAPYYIHGLDYRQSSAGIRVLHHLCHALNELGEEAYIVANVTNPYLRTPKITKGIIARHAQTGRLPIAVYPEVVTGNPFQAHVVARWILNKPGHIGGELVYDPDELLFIYQKTYAPEGVLTHPLYIPAVDGRIFNNRDNPCDGKRAGACYYAHKYLVFGGALTHHASGAISLCQDIARSHEEIADILRRSEVMYSYEPSAIVTEALQCGCPVVMIPSDYIAANYDYTLLQGPGVEIGSDDQALVRAKETLKNFNVRIHAVHAELTLRKFVDITQAAMADRLRNIAEAGIQAAVPVLGQVQEASLSSYNLWRVSHRDSGPTATTGPVVGAVFQIVIPALGARQAGLEATLASIAKQGYSRWRVSILSDAPAPAGFVEADGISWSTLAGPDFVTACNRLIGAGGFDWLWLVEAGDVLEEHALASIQAAASRHPEWQAVYADEDSLEDGGQCDRPYFKPDYLIDFHRAAPYALSGGVAFKRELLQQLSGFDVAAEGAENYDLLLRAYEKSGASGIGHVADVLYHRSPESGHCTRTQDELIAVRRSVLQAHLARLGCAADVDDGVLPGTFRIRYRLDGNDMVSIIVPTLNGGAFLQRCIGAIVETTDYRNWELIVVDQESDDPDTLAFLGLLRDMNNDAVRVITQPRASRLPALINAGARQARGHYLLFMSDATAPLRRDWLDEMLGYAVQPGVGVVGAKMIGSDSHISFAGYILGLEGRPAGLHDLHAAPDALGYFGQLQVPGNPSAVSATCMLTGKALFDELGGFDEEKLADGYSDVDYCLKSWQAGRRVVWTPFALLLQEHMTEPPRAGDDDEDADADSIQRTWHLPTVAEQAMFERWLDRIAFDPAYNRNLSLTAGAYEIEIAPALTWDPESRPLPRVLAHTGDRHGCGEYRIMAPMRALLAQGRVQGWETGYYLTVPELARMAPDSLVLQRQVTPKHIMLMDSYFAHSKAFRVFELDDLMTNIQISNEARQGYQAKDLVKRFRQVLDRCDRFVVSTDYLAEEYRKYKREIVVAPNTIERAKWGDFRPARRAGRKPRVGWAGSLSHVGDLALVADVVKALKDEVEWVFFGLCPEGVRPLVEYHAAVPIEQYPARLASLNLDLALAPLEDVPFNHAKSHLRLLEYGVLGYPVICTDITPYRGDYPVARVRNRYKDWVDAIREHVSDMDALARRGDALRDHVNARWILEDNLDIWLKAWLP
ncbi:MAG: glycosyltransferase [Gallionellaceae bacterium]|nr:glycosyltransferase [Gallionellaceae bacterium]